MSDFVINNGVLVSYQGPGGNVVIPEGMTSIGCWAFSDCEIPACVTIPASVTSIGDYAFSNCRGLTSVTIPESVTSICCGAFSGCRSLTCATIPASVTSIGDRAFYCCESLTSVTIPASVKSIDRKAFYYCSSLTSVTIPAGVTRISDETFESCRSLQSVKLPEGVTEIGEKAFYECTSLVSVNIPDSVRSIGYGTFEKCKSLSEVTLPDSLTQLAPHIFAGCSSLTKLNLPKSLTKIGDVALQWCKIPSVVIPDGVTEIGRNAFSRCAKLRSAGPVGSGCDYEFPWTEEIPAYAFSGMRELERAVLPATIKKVGGNAFKDCSSLCDLTMPAAAKVSKNTFAGCGMLGQIKEPEAVPAGPAAEGGGKVGEAPAFVIVKDRLLRYNGEEHDVVIPDGVKIIGARAFRWRRLHSVTIPASVETIEQEAFEGCHALSSVTIQGKIKKLGANAFPWFAPGSAGEAAMLSIFKSIPLGAYTASAQSGAIWDFCRLFSGLDQTSEVFRDDLRFIGSHLKLPQKYGDKLVYHHLFENEALRHAVLEADAIPAKEVNWLVEAAQSEADTAIVAELLAYKDRLLSVKGARKKLEQQEKQAAEKVLRFERSVADWRKLLRFTYENGDIVITGVNIREPVIEIPGHIGTRRVRVIASGAFAYNLKPGEKQFWCPEKIILPEGIEEIRSAAFCCGEDIEIHFPSTVKALPEGCFCAVENLTLYLPASVEQIGEELAFDSADTPFKAFCAPAGSYAEQYAKEHGIPYEAI